MANNKTAAAPQVDFSRLPRHVAIILDGNGRWAKKRGLPRTPVTLTVPRRFDASATTARPSASNTLRSTPFPRKTGAVRLRKCARS